MVKEYFPSCLAAFGISFLHVFLYTSCTIVFCSAGKDYPVQASTRDEMLVWIKFIDDARVSQDSISCSVVLVNCNFN